MAVMITGHRPASLPYGYNENDARCRELRITLGALIASLRDAGQADFITGMALGVDTWFAELCMARDVQLHAFVPFTGQEKRWPEASQARYHRILGDCTTRRITSPSIQAGAPGHLIRDALLERNSRMLEHASIVIAVWNGEESGGTWDAVRKARAAGKLVIHVSPDGFLVGS